MTTSIKQLSEYPNKGDFLEIYIPKESPGTPQLIDGGSGIVGFYLNDQFTVYFEGNRFDACNLQMWDEKVRQAYGRLVQRYPTIAKANVDPNLYECVGITNGSQVKITNRDKLMDYLAKSNKLDTIPNSDETSLIARTRHIF